MTVLQAALLGFICWFGSLSGAFAIGPTGGWYVISRPLVAGLICGIVLGDVPTGVLIGVAIQTVYIALITPGGAVPADMSYACYLAIPFAMITKTPADQAVTLGVGFGLLGVAMWQLTSVGQAFWAHLADRYAEEGNLKGIYNINIWAQIPNFLLRGVVTFLVLYFGQGVATSILDFLNTQIPWFMQFLSLAGGALPAVGIAILLFQIATSTKMLIWFFLGWILVAIFKVNTVALAFIGAIVALIYFLYLSKIEEKEA